MSAQPQRKATHRGPSGPQGAIARVVAAWHAMHVEQRIAGTAALGLFVTMLLPWYTKTDVLDIQGKVQPTQGTFTAFGAFSFVEAAVLLVSVFVVAVVFARAEGRAFHLPGGDGTIIMLAGAWAAILIFYRLFAKPTLHHTAVITATEGVTWGIFIALLVALAITYAGWRMRAAGRPEPPLLLPRRREPTPRPARAAERTTTVEEVSSPPTVQREPNPTVERTGPSEDRPRYPRAPQPPSREPGGRSVTREDAAQLSFDDPPAVDPADDQRPAARRPR